MRFKQKIYNVEQNNIKIWDENLIKKKMKININKTEIIVIYRNENKFVKQRGKIKIPKNSNRKERTYQKEINNKRAVTIKLYHTIRNGF